MANNSSILYNRYSISVNHINGLPKASKYFSNCWCPYFFIDMIAPYTTGDAFLVRCPQAAIHIHVGEHVATKSRRDLILVPIIAPTKQSLHKILK